MTNIVIQPFWRCNPWYSIFLRFNLIRVNRIWDSTLFGIPSSWDSILFEIHSYLRFNLLEILFNFRKIQSYSRFNLIWDSIFLTFNLEIQSFTIFLRFYILESQSSWDSMFLKFNLHEIQSSWDSIFLKFNLLEIQSSWDSIFLRFNVLEIQSYLRFSVLEIQLLWDSTSLRFNLLEIQIEPWDSWWGNYWRKKIRAGTVFKFNVEDFWAILIVYLVKPTDTVGCWNINIPWGYWI